MDIGGLPNGLQVLKGAWLSSGNYSSSHLAKVGVRESMSDSGYGHDDISCMKYDIHIDILLGCVFSVRPLHVHLGGE